MAILIPTIFVVLLIGSLVRLLWALALAMLMFPIEQSLQGALDAIWTREPYSYSIIVDVLTELAIPALITFGYIMASVVHSGLNLFRAWSQNEARRVAITIFVAVGLYQFLLVNKKGYLCGVGLSFLHWLIIVRVWERSDPGGAAVNE